MAVHFASAPEAVWQAGRPMRWRERFWAEASLGDEDGFDLGFINGETLRVEIVEARPDALLVFRYFGGSTVTLEFAPDGSGGCDLRLREQGAPEPIGNYAGWVSVLLACKAAVDFGIDLRSHDPGRSWDSGFVDV